MGETTNSDAEAHRDANRDRGGEKAAQGAPPWLLRYRVTMPDPAAHHVHRSTLIERCMPTARRLTVLLAGGGFGKTTLLAECCRVLRDRGAPTAWLTLEDDAPGMLDNYLALAFEEAGLDLLGPLDDASNDVDVVHHRAGLLVRAIEAHGGPCVLALDEMERLRDPNAVALLNFLVRSCPAGLHLALAGRELPKGLDISRMVLGGHAETLTASDLRFSAKEIGEFFDRRLTRRELAEVVAESAGWPMALRIRRNLAGQPQAAVARLFDRVVEDWVESRLWFDLAEDDRQFVLDVGLFEWLTPGLLEEVLGEPGSMQRLAALQGLDGLIEPVGTPAGNVCRLHPLIQEYCSDRRRRDTPQRFQATHRRIAKALAARGDVVAAQRHAAAAGDAELVGRILTEAGGIRLWLREGADRLVAAERYLSDETLAAYPQLALVRCVTLVAMGRIEEARSHYECTTRATVSAELAVDSGAGIDRLIVRGLMMLIACESVGSANFRETLADVGRVASMKKVHPVVRGALAYGLCQGHGLRAEFDTAQAWGTRARRWIAKRSEYLRMTTALELGQIAMAQGRVHSAAKWYGRGLRAARADFLREPRFTVYAEVLVGELALERSRIHGHSVVGRVSMDWYACCPRFGAFAAASELAVEGAFVAGGADGALSTLDEMTEFAVRSVLPTVGRVVAALRVSTLSLAGRIAEAERAWRTAALPDTDSGCLDLDGQSWREMEALSCARVRLLSALGAFDDARVLARELTRTANARGLRRTAMRALALSLSLAHHAGNRSSAVAHAEEYLALFAETDYARPVVRERDVAAAVLREFLDARPDSTHRTAAQVLLEAAERLEPPPPALSVREADVLRRLETESDAQIAAALGITRDGVRYYVKRLFGKLEVRSRFAAARRARILGILPAED